MIDGENGDAQKKNQAILAFSQMSIVKPDPISVYTSQMSIVKPDPISVLLTLLVFYKFGIIKGGIVMTFLSFITCIGTLKFYDWSKRDWLGIEAIKDLKGYEGEKKIGRFTSWFLKRSDPVAFLFLSIWYDPFIVTAYLRHGANKFNGMNNRDWKIFIGSLIFGNAYWTLACYMGISLVEWAWKTIARG